MIFLAPLGWLYGRIMQLRNALYDRGTLPSYDTGAKTISVGNITTGGTGKTPLVAYIANLLAENGENVCVLTRGYSRRNEGERVLVSDGEKVLADPEMGGDEPVELAKKLLGKAVVIADADRVSAASWAKANFGITVFVLDDAFQHRRAKRHLDVVCIDATNPFGGGRILPLGSLRERLSSIARADAIVITRSDALNLRMMGLKDALSVLHKFVPTTDEELDEWYRQAKLIQDQHFDGGVAYYLPIYLWHYLSDADIRMKDKEYASMDTHRIELLLEDLKQPLEAIKKQIRAYNSIAPLFASGTEIVEFRSLSKFETDHSNLSWVHLVRNNQLRVLGFCGLGNPKAFFTQLETRSQEKLDLVMTHTFPDHHRYTQSDINLLQAKARDAGIDALVTTSKDAVKLEGIEFSMPCFVAEIEVVIDDPVGFRDLVLSP
jgi:tetraacyldisaccharide-1-P 4'-kinase